MSLSIRDVVIPPDEVPAWIQSNHVSFYLDVVLLTLVVYDSRTCSDLCLFWLYSHTTSLYVRQGGTVI